MRLDQNIAALHGISRTRAQDWIRAGRVRVAGRTITKPSFDIQQDDEVQVEQDCHDYVSRAGGKLAAAFDAFGIDIAGQCVLDIGASTGGFTQCCLEHGAAKVFALDVGHLQLSPALKSDPRVAEMEGFNVREIRRDLFEPPVDFVCMDVSFISAITALQAVFAQFVPAHCAILVKPQFECGPAALNKKGVIRHPKYEKEALDKVSAYLGGFYSRVRSIASPVVGRSGNQEYIVYASSRKEEAHD